MFTRLLCGHISGIDAIAIEVEVDIASMGLPSFSVVGLAEGAVKESKERVKAALKNLGYNIFAKPITVNLAPADVKKDGSHYDLPLAVALVMSDNPDLITNTDIIADTMFLGELSLDGNIRGVSGVLCIAAWAKESGIKRLIVPADNLGEASLVDGLTVLGFTHLSDVLAYLTGANDYIPPKIKDSITINDPEPDFAEVKGQFTARRAAEIAAAGMHNLIMIGSPGSGKTMIAKRIPSILPEMDSNEALLTTKIHSVAGLLKNKGSLITKRPFIAPHHTASDVAVVGGGAKAMPGHVSIATNGVLFLDEMLEFNRSVLEVLRQPLEEGNVTIARAGRTATYPADFMLVAACNPCPCGYYGDEKKECKCSASAVERYRSRLSGPLMDRIDLQIRVQSINHAEINASADAESSEKIRKRVEKAHIIQKKRFKGRKISYNSQMSVKDIQKYCALNEQSLKLLQNAMEKFGLSARAYNKILKTSRTIADLAESENIKTAHVAESLQYRGLDRV